MEVCVLKFEYKDLVKHDLGDKVRLRYRNHVAYLNKSDIETYYLKDCIEIELLVSIAVEHNLVEHIDRRWIRK